MEHILEHNAAIMRQPHRYHLIGNKDNLSADLKIEVYVGDASFVRASTLRAAFDTKATINIGKFTSIMEGSIMQLGSNQHQATWATLYPYYYLPWDESIRAKDTFPDPDGKWDINIGNDVWIGGARIFSGVTIGDGAVIESGAVVTKDVPPYAVYSGNPGSVKSYRFEPKDIDFLLETRWWDFPFDTIQALGPYLCSPNINELKQKIATLPEAVPQERLAA